MNMKGPFHDMCEAAPFVSGFACNKTVCRVSAADRPGSNGKIRSPG